MSTHYRPAQLMERGSLRSLSWAVKGDDSFISSTEEGSGTMSFAFEQKERVSYEN